MTDAMAAEEAIPLMPYLKAAWTDGTQQKLRAERVDGEVEYILADLKDPRYLLITEGDPDRNIAPLRIGAMPLEELKASAIRAVKEACKEAEIQPLQIGNRVFSADESGYRAIKNHMEGVTTARKLGIVYEMDVVLANGRIVHMVDQEFVAVWLALQERFGRLPVIAQIAADRIALARNEEDVQREVEAVTGKLVELTGVNV